MMGPSMLMASSAGRRSDPVHTDGGRGDSDSWSSSIALPEYNLRPRSVQNRIETEGRRARRRVKEPKPKHQPAPLSKYRRKTANARERTRMTEINRAFEELRQAVPRLPSDPTPVSAAVGGDKLTKITTLRLAMNYIKALSQIIKEQDEEACTVPTASGIPQPVTSTHKLHGDHLDTRDAPAATSGRVDQLLLMTPPSDGGHGDLMMLDDPCEGDLRDFLDPLAAALSEDSSVSSSMMDPLVVGDFPPSLLGSPVPGFDALLESDGDSNFAASK